MSAHVGSRQLIVESCSSTSNNLISLSYLMPVFSANLFGPFLKRKFFKGDSRLSDSVQTCILRNMYVSKETVVSILSFIQVLTADFKGIIMHDTVRTIQFTIDI